MVDKYNKKILVEIDGEKYERTLLTTLEKSEVGSRGLGGFTFKDAHEKQCSLQDSSLATESAIWFGIDDPEPIIMACDVRIEGDPPLTGWVKYPIPENVSIRTRMHFTQEQVKKLLPILIHFAETGEYLRDYKEKI